MPAPDPTLFRQFMGSFATGITVVTAKDEELGAIGLTVNSLTSVSLKPPLVLFCIDKTAKLYATLKRADYFAFNILSAKQEEISRHFADYRHHPKPKAMWDKPQQGCPVLRHTLGWMVCRQSKIYKGGDHDIIVGEVVKLHKRTTSLDPLLYFHGRYRNLG